MPCAADRFSTAGASACLCPDGTFAEDASAPCVPCAAGTYFQKFAINVSFTGDNPLACTNCADVRGIYHPWKHCIDPTCTSSNRYQLGQIGLIVVPEAPAGGVWKHTDGAYVLCSTWASRNSILFVFAAEQFTDCDSTSYLMQLTNPFYPRTEYSLAYWSQSWQYISLDINVLKLPWSRCVACSNDTYSNSTGQF